MTKQKSTNWLQPFIKKAKTTQDALALEINVSSKTIQRWGNYETLNNILFNKLAIALQTNERSLRDAHRKGLDRHHATKIPINKKFISNALIVVESIGLTARVLDRLQLETTEEAVDEIASWIQKGNMQPFMENFNQLIKSAVDVVEPDQIGDLDLIEKFIRNIALATSIEYDKEKLNDNTLFDISGITKPWPLRLVVDASKNRQMTGTTAESSTELKTAGSVKIEETKKDEVWQRVHEIIVILVEELFLKEDVVPELIEDEEYSTFRAYCKDRLNEVIDQENYVESQVFLYALQQESIEVREKLIELLPKIKIFICGKGFEAASVLRIEERRLESWIATGLFAIKTRREQIKLNLPKEEEVMKQDNESTPAMNLTVNNGGSINLAMGHSSANQANSSAIDYSQLIEALKKLLSATNPTISEHRQLRGDVKEILDSVEKTGDVPEASKNWLQDSLTKLKLGENVKTGVGLMIILEKLIKLM